MSIISRQGTASRKAGRETASKIIQAAHDLLESESLTRFTMRNIAAKAGVSLANLQYYYPRREEIINAMVVDIDARYRKASQRVIDSQAASAPLEQFEAILRFQLEDAAQSKTRQFFIQFWALLGSMDDFSGSYLEELYAYDIQILSEPIAQLHGNMPKSKIREKAVLIASLVEGLMVVIGDTSKNRAASKRTIESVFRTARMIALESESSGKA